MEKNIEKAVKLYSGDKPLGLFVDHLDAHLKRMNALFEQISDIFTQAGIKDFEKLPPELGDRVKFVQLFNELNKVLEAAKIQGFTWEQSLYSFDDGSQRQEITCVFDKHTYDALVARYKELSRPGGGGGEGEGDAPFDIKGYITTIETADIDADYMNGRFVKFLKLLRQDDATEEALQQAVEALHRSFAALSQEEQKIANILLHDIQLGNFIPEEGKPLRDYITEEQTKAQKRRIDAVVAALGVDGTLLAEFLNTAVTEQNLNEFGRFDKLLATVDLPRAKAWFEQRENTRLIPPKVRIKANNYLKAFILGGGVAPDEGGPGE